MEHSTYAAELFVKGYNCAQAVMVAFCDLTGLDETYAAKLSSSFGAGMGGLREVCGAVSGMLAVAGILYGYDDPEDGVSKKAHYTLVQEFTEKFRAQTGSIICREILNNPPTDPNPSPRTAQYYKERPCAQMVFIAAQILDEYISKNSPC